jgi:hypothetical protein
MRLVQSGEAEANYKTSVPSDILGVTLPRLRKRGKNLSPPRWGCRESANDSTNAKGYAVMTPFFIKHGLELPARS